MLFRSTQSHSTGIEPGSDRNCSTSRGQGRVSSYVPHPLAADDVERDTYPVLDDFGGQLVALGTRLTSKGADRATLIRDLLNLVPMSDNKPLQFLICDTGPGGDHCAPGFRSTASTLLNEEGVRRRCSGSPTRSRHAEISARDATRS